MRVVIDIFGQQLLHIFLLLQYYFIFLIQNPSQILLMHKQLLVSLTFPTCINLEFGDELLEGFLLLLELMVVVFDFVEVFAQWLAELFLAGELDV